MATSSADGTGGAGENGAPRKRPVWLTCLLVTAVLAVVAVAGIWAFVTFLYHDY